MVDDGIAEFRDGQAEPFIEHLEQLAAPDELSQNVVDGPGLARCPGELNRLVEKDIIDVHGHLHAMSMATMPYRCKS